MTAERNAVTLVPDFAGTRVLIVGDVMLDEYVWGDVTRVSPEAPIPVVDVNRTSRVPGGSANTAAGVVALGGTALLAGVVGIDNSAEGLRDQLRGRHIATDGLVSDGSRPTTTKTRVLAGSQHVVRLDSESRDELVAGVEADLLDWALGHLPGAGAVVLSDYAKGVVSPRVAREVITLARARRVPVVVDPKGRDFTRYRGATVITPNVREAEEATGIAVRGDADVRRVGRALLELLGEGAVLLTRGPCGMSLFSSGGPAEPVHIPAVARQVFDVTGAGDTVVATLALALANRVPLVDAARLATLAAGLVVGKVGTSTVTAVELLQGR